MKKFSIYINLVMLLLIGSAITSALKAQSVTPAAARKAKATPEEIAVLKKAVETNPDSLSAHKAYIKAMGMSFNKDNPELIAQYKKWMAQYPKNINFPLAIGEQLADNEMPEAKEFLLKVVEMDPKNAKAWESLSFDADRWGKSELSQQYMEKAALADPKEPSYGFYALNGGKDIDPASYPQRVMDFAKRFPDNERGAQAVYWLAADSKDKGDKIKCYELLRSLYPVKKFQWSAGGMYDLYDLYMQTNIDKALQLANEMGDDKDWVARKAFAKAILPLNNLIQAGNYTAAIDLLNQAKLPKYSSVEDYFNLKKAMLQDQAGNTKAAYDSLTTKFAKMPTDELLDGAEMYGAKLSKDKVQVQRDVQEIRNNAAKPAFPFDLGMYTINKNLSLSDLKGKVVLLTFWFPGCGPCRGEFPHFQAVINEYKGQQVEFVGINVSPEQNPYVISFMENTKYSFIPLHGTDEVTKAFGVRGEPTNFLIDQNGKIVYRDFRINGDNQRTLELMINSLLQPLSD